MTKKQLKLTARRPLIIALAVVVVLAVGATVWAGTRTGSDVSSILPHKNTSPSPSPSSGNGTAAGQLGTSATPTPKGGSTGPSGTGVPVGPVPNAPTGDLLSIHAVSLSSGATKLESTCQTAAGITCSVQAKNGSITKTMATATTDANGGAILDWDAKSLSAGTWEIRVVATTTGGSTTSTIFDELKVTS